MDADACFQLGYIKATHGLKGDVQVILDVDDPEDYYHLESVFLDQTGQGTLVPFFVRYIHPQSGKLIIKFEEVNELQEARKLIGKTVYLPLAALPELSEASFYYHEMLGCEVRDHQRGLLGTVSCIYDQSPQVLLGMSYRGHEILIPFTDEIVPAFDKSSRVVHVNLPAGLLEIYLEDQNSNHEN